ncbi:MAG: hypothetical protein WC815_21525 [Vicinamibacterales bacterium]|jgi:hypothetical protein
MATFHYNRFSGESANSQWSRYLQTQSYISEIGEIVSQNRKDLQATLNAASAEQKQAFQQVCGTLNDGFREVSQHLQDINCNISELRGEISDMAAMLDWKLSLMIEEQRLTNQLLGHVVRLLRIPDSQKQRAYHIEQGLKYLKNAIREGINSTFYADALEGFREAERIERKDYITLNRIGQIHLYSRQHMDIPLAEEYFLKSAREAFAEENAGGTPTATHLVPKGDQPLIYSDSPFKAATAEAYVYAARACYLQQKLPQAATHAGNAYRLVPEFLEAGFEQAKYLAANGQDDEAVAVLRAVIGKDRYFAVKTLTDADLAGRKPVLELLGDFHAKAISQATREFRGCADIITNGSEGRPVFMEAEHHLSQNSFLSAMKALDVLTTRRQLPYKQYRLDSGVIYGKTLTPSQTLMEFIRAENQGANQLEELIPKAKSEILRNSLMGFPFGGAAIGFVIGFFRGCSPSQFSVDGGTWLATILFCAVLGAAIGGFVGYVTEPSVQG